MKISFFNLVSVGFIAILSLLLWKSNQENKLLKGHLAESLKMIESINTDILPNLNANYLRSIKYAIQASSNASGYFSPLYPIQQTFDTLMNCIERNDFSQNHRLANKILNRDTVFKELMQRKKFFVSEWSVLKDVPPYNDSLVRAAIKAKYRFETAYIQNNYFNYMTSRIGCCRVCPDMFIGEDKMKCLILSQATTLKVGEPLQANIVLVSCLSPLFTSMTVNGYAYKPTDNSGYIEIPTLTASVGDHTLVATYTVINPNTGERRTVKSDLKYHIVPK
jgi:hypothetical protein